MKIVLTGSAVALSLALGGCAWLGMDDRQESGAAAQGNTMMEQDASCPTTADASGTQTTNPNCPPPAQTQEPTPEAAPEPSPAPSEPQ